MPYEDDIFLNGEIIIGPNGITYNFNEREEFPYHDQNSFSDDQGVLQFRIFYQDGKAHLEILDMISKAKMRSLKLYSIFTAMAQDMANYLNQDILVEAETAMFRVKTFWNGENAEFTKEDRDRDVSSRLGWHQVKKIQSEIKLQWIKVIEPLLTEKNIPFETMSTEGIDQDNFRFYAKSVTPIKTDTSSTTGSSVSNPTINRGDQNPKTDVTEEDTTDSAELGRKSDVGGIDLNPEMLDLKTKGERSLFNLPAEFKYLESTPINGFTPVIIEIVPVTNLPVLLGTANENQPREIINVSSVN